MKNAYSKGTRILRNPRRVLVAQDGGFLSLGE